MSFGCNVCNSRIQNSLFSVFDYLSNLDCGQWYNFLDLPKSSNECPGDTKCWLTGKSVFFIKSLLCPFILLLNGWSLSPTYCDPNSKFISLTTIQVGKKIKDRKKRVFASASYKHYTRRHKQKGLNLLFFNFLTSAWSLASW